MAKRRRFTKEQRIAYHEAGHAVADYYLGKKFKHISTYKGKGSKGRVVGIREKQAPPFTAERMKQLDDEIMGRMAGTLAECVLRGRRTYTWMDLVFGGSVDFERVYRIADARLYGHCMGDGRDKEKDAFLRWLEIRTCNLLKMNWGAVETLAETLLERKKLTYDEAVEAMNQGPDRGYYLNRVDGGWQILKEEAA
jgi:ATP-dependent Zn protease